MEGVLGGDRGNLPTVAKTGAEASTLARQRKAGKRNVDLLPIIRQIQAEAATPLNAIAAKLNERGIQAPRGGGWHPNSVGRILAGSKFNRVLLNQHPKTLSRTRQGQFHRNKHS